MAGRAERGKSADAFARSGREGDPTSTASNIALIRHLYEEIDKGNEAVLEEVFAPDFVEHDPASTPPGPAGLVGLRQGFERFAAAFEDSEHVIEDVVAAGDKVVVRVTGRGIHRGTYMGVPPTGKRVSMGGIAIYRIAHGKIVEEWSQADRLDFLRQLGILPPAKSG